jgi:hypothetical protein
MSSHTTLPSLNRHNPKPLLPILVGGEFQVFLLDDLWGISTFQGDSLDIMGHSHTIADTRIPEFVGTHINAQAFAMPVEGLEQGLWSAPTILQRRFELQFFTPRIEPRDIIDGLKH